MLTRETRDEIRRAWDVHSRQCVRQRERLDRFVEKGLVEIPASMTRGPLRDLDGANGDRPEWDADRIVEAIRIYARENGRFPTTGAWMTRTDDRFPIYREVRAVFPTWAGALTAAGCPTDVQSHLVWVAEDGTVSVVDAPSGVRRPAVVEPEPEGERAGDSEPEAPIIVLDEYAEFVRVAHRRYIEAEAALDNADAALREACDRLLAHVIEG